MKVLRLRDLPRDLYTWARFRWKFGWWSELRMARVVNAMKRKEKNCNHSEYRGLRTHGRLCPDCAAMMVDFGD